MIPLSELFKKIDRPYTTRMPHRMRVMETDPARFVPIVEKYGNRKLRYSSISMKHLFPKRDDGMCVCGCGAQLTGRRAKYATDTCSKYCEAVWGIISCHNGILDGYVMDLYGHKCANCDDRTGLEVDHIIEVCDGGARAWLSNYQLLCKRCHKAKTNQSRIERKLLSANTLM